MDDLEKTIGELKQEAGHLKILIESNKKAILEEVHEKISEGNERLTKEVSNTMKDAIKDITK